MRKSRDSLFGTAPGTNSKLVWRACPIPTRIPTDLMLCVVDPVTRINPALMPVASNFPRATMDDIAALTLGEDFSSFEWGVYTSNGG